MSEDASNRRQATRKQLCYYVPVHSRGADGTVSGPGKEQAFHPEVLDNRSETLLGRIVDITKFGCQLISKTETKLRQGDHLQASISTEDVPTISENIDVSLTCRWIAKDVNPDYQVAGYQFEDTNDATRDQIGMLIAALHAVE